jgi:hypothetical protein
MRHFINDIEISPKNVNEIGLISDFTIKDNPEILSLNVDSITLVREGYDIVKQHISNIGIFEGIPYRVEMEPGISLQYYVDLTDAGCVFRNHECEVKIKRRLANDSFFDNANATSFELMLKKGQIFPTFNVPYVVIKDNQLELGVSLSLSIFGITRELIAVAKEIQESIAEIVQATTLNTGVPPSVDTGDIIALYIKLAARIVYFAALFLAIYDLASQLFVLIFPPIRYLKACKLKDLLQVGCAFLGYGFESTTLDAFPNYTILPVPLIRDRDSIIDITPDALIPPFNKGVPSSSDTVSTLGALMNAATTLINGETRVIDGVVKMERWDYYQNATGNQLTPALNLQAERDDSFTYNVDDIWKRYYIHYNLDLGDFHTLDIMYNWHDAEYSTEATNYVNADLVSIKGLNDVNPPFSLGRRKNNFTYLELLAKSFFNLIDNITSIFGNGTNFESQIDKRLGVLMIGQSFFTQTKLLWTVGGKQTGDYTNYISAKALWNNYHYINQIQFRDAIIKSDARVMLTNAEFVTLLTNNYAEIDGLICEILRIEFIDETHYAQITYKMPDNYAAGRVQTLIIND